MKALALALIVVSSIAAWLLVARLSGAEQAPPLDTERARALDALVRVTRAYQHCTSDCSWTRGLLIEGAIEYADLVEEKK